jgi:polysaccharide biosynthesis transport protein
MELRRYARLLRQRILLLAVAVVVGLGAGYLATNRVHHYQSVATIYVGSRQFSAVANSTDANGAMERVIQTFAAMIKSAPIATAARQLTHAPRITGQIEAETIAAAVPDTNYIVVVVTDTDPVIAQSLANGVAAGFVAQVQTLEPGAAGAGTPAVTSVFQQATRPTSALPTSTRPNVALGGLLGLGAGVALVALINYLDISVKSPADAERATGVPVLGTVPALPRRAAPARLDRVASLTPATGRAG